MTVNTTTITSGPYTGNNAVSVYSYTFRIESKTQLKVFETTDLGVQTELTVDTDYTVAGIGDDAGGLITRVAGNLPTDYTWYIRADYAETQETDLASQGAFYPEVHEAAFDKLTFLSQQTQDLLGRAVSLDESYSGSASALLPEPIANLYFRWNATADAIEYSSSPVDLSAPGAIGGTTPAAITGTTITANTSVVTDTIAEKTTTNGVTVDGLNIKDGKLNTADSVVESNITNGAVTVNKIGTSAVSLAKMADLVADVIIGRANGAGTGVPTALSASQVRTIINVENGATADQTGAEIKTALFAEPDTNNFTDADVTKFDSNLAGGKVLLETIVASASTTINLGTGGEIDGTYTSYLIEYTYALPSVDNKGLLMLASTDLGVSYLGGTTYTYDYSTESRSGPGSGSSTGGSSINLGTVAGTATNEVGICGEITIYDPAASKYTLITHKSAYINALSIPIYAWGMATVGSTTPLDAFRLYFSSADVASGTFKLYGLV